VSQPIALGDDLVERRGIGVGTRLQAFESAEALGPFERPDRVFDREHRRGVDRFALEDAFAELATLGQAEDFRQRPGRRVAFQPLHGPRTRSEERRVGKDRKSWRTPYEAL